MVVGIINQHTRKYCRDTNQQHYIILCKLEKARCRLEYPETRTFEYTETVIFGSISDLTCMINDNNQSTTMGSPVSNASSGVGKCPILGILDITL